MSGFLMFYVVRITMLQYTFDELLDQVQASEGELFKAIQDLQACLIEGTMAFFPPPQCKYGHVYMIE